MALNCLFLAIYGKLKHCCANFCHCQMEKWGKISSDFKNNLRSDNMKRYPIGKEQHVLKLSVIEGSASYLENLMDFYIVF